MTFTYIKYADIRIEEHAKCVSNTIVDRYEFNYLRYDI